MSFYFFPRNKTFWIYHGSVLLLLSIVQAAVIMLWRESVMFNAVAGLLWLPLFTLATLYYRYLYKHRHWNQLGTSKNILIVLLYSTASSFLVTLLMIGCTFPFFWDEVKQLEEVVKQQATLTEITVQHIIGNSLQTQIFISGWIFIYISITTKQRIVETELTNLRLQNSLKEAELSNLTNQLNPHFLFNALNNIRFIIYEDQHKADLMLTALADVLRYSLESSQRPKVRLEQELAIVNRYIDIIKIQMEKRLTFKLEISAQLHNCLIPPMLLQLLIENAIKHGIDHLRAGGAVTVKAENIHQKLHFYIANSAPENKGKSVHTMGIGLKNIEQRLALLYGDAASFHIKHQDSEFSVHLTIPCEKDE
ncbi:MAG: hypothetical protein B0W54_05850 [Cellvibrio sp. 79]|nr:MAG: hypothetical protein B0W54_05850 [Cellvibrio sp. 79]